jgi:predicted lactoylglutathione lyase
LLALSADSPQAVDAMVEAAGSAGGKKDPGPKQDMGGLMYGRSFEDPDGHHWEPMWMDAKAAEQGASSFEESMKTEA